MDFLSHKDWGEDQINELPEDFHIIGITFTENNEPFVYSNYDIASMSQPDEINFPIKQSIIGLHVDNSLDFEGSPSYDFSLEYINLNKLDFELNLRPRLFSPMDQEQDEAAAFDEKLLYKNRDFLINNRNNHLYLNKDFKTELVRFSYPDFVNEQKNNGEFNQKSFTTFSGDQLLTSTSKQYLISKDGPFVSYQSHDGKVLASFYSLGKKIIVRKGPINQPNMPDILSYDSTNVWGWTKKGALAFQIAESETILGIEFLPGSYSKSMEKESDPIFKCYFLTYTSKMVKIWDDQGKLITAIAIEGSITNVVLNQDKTEIYIVDDKSKVTFWQILDPQKQVDLAVLTSDS